MRASSSRGDNPSGRPRSLDLGVSPTGRALPPRRGPTHPHHPSRHWVAALSVQALSVQAQRSTMAFAMLPRWARPCGRPHAVLWTTAVAAARA